MSEIFDPNTSFYQNIIQDIVTTERNSGLQLDCTKLWSFEIEQNNRIKNSSKQQVQIYIANKGFKNIWLSPRKVLNVTSVWQTFWFFLFFFKMKIKVASRKAKSNIWWKFQLSISWWTLQPTMQDKTTYIKVTWSFISEQGRVGVRPLK